MSKTEFTTKPIFTMWLKKSKKGAQYLSGVDAAGQRLVGFINAKKENPKQPDITVYGVNEDGTTAKEQYTSLWCNLSKGGRKYLSGKMGGNKIVGFINGKAEVGSKIPYFSVYESNTISKKEEAEDFKVLTLEEANELPF